MNVISLELCKQDFKFSAAHFLIFNSKRAERLHGHNYSVRLHLLGESKTQLQDGFLVDFSEIKRIVRKSLSDWDEKVLLPKESRYLTVVDSQRLDSKKNPAHGHSKKFRNWIVYYADRRYEFPKEDVILLPINNSSVENFARLLADSWAEKFKKWPIKELTVTVEETAGQSASYTKSVGNRP